MKTAISMPDAVFKEAEQYAHRMGKSRSSLYVEAIEEYLARHQANAVTWTMNEVMEEMTPYGTTESGKADAAFLKAAAKRTLKREEW